MTAGQALARHWPEYLIEGWGLGTFMVSAGVVATVLSLPQVVHYGLLQHVLVRGVLAGLAMGLTSLALVYSHWGQRSGAHFNPALTLAFLRLRRVHTWDAVFFILAQCIGGLLGVMLVSSLLGEAFTAPPVAYATTLPGEAGPWVAFGAEAVISFILMFVVLIFSSNPRIASFTGVAAASLVVINISFEAPLSGMSMNPARSLASALPAHHLQDLWIYLSAPLLGMLAAAHFYRMRPEAKRCGCAKVMHSDAVHCIHCNQRLSASEAAGVQRD